VHLDPVAAPSGSNVRPNSKAFGSPRDSPGEARSAPAGRSRSEDPLLVVRPRPVRTSRTPTPRRRGTTLWVPDTSRRTDPSCITPPAASRAATSGLLIANPFLDRLHHFSCGIAVKQLRCRFDHHRLPCHDSSMSTCRASCASVSAKPKLHGRNHLEDRLEPDLHRASEPQDRQRRCSFRARLGDQPRRAATAATIPSSLSALRPGTVQRPYSSTSSRVVPSMPAHIVAAHRDPRPHKTSLR